MFEAYGQNKIRAQARANILNSEGAGWIVDYVEGQYVVRHDGITPPPTGKPRATICIQRRQFNKRRVDLVIKAA